MPQVVCGLHDVRRWLSLSWYVSRGHMEHSRRAVVVCADISLPRAQVVCDEHSRLEVLVCGVRTYSLCS